MWGQPPRLSSVGGAPQQLPRSRFQPHLLPQPVPLPDASPHRRGNPISQLMRQHQNLPSMMRLMREHIRKHRPTRRPHRSPTSSRKLGDPARMAASQCIRQHAQALLRTLRMRFRRLLHCALVRIQRCRTLQVRRRIPDPHEPTIVQMRKDRRNRPPATSLPQRLRPPCPRIEMRQQMLVHQIIDCIGFHQYGRKVFSRILKNFPRP
jgi:hypothetical protein